MKKCRALTTFQQKEKDDPNMERPTTLSVHLCLTPYRLEPYLVMQLIGELQQNLTISFLNQADILDKRH